MKKTKLGFLLGSALLVQSSAFAATASLEDQLRGLNVPDNQAPAGVTRERLYAVQNRYAELRGRSELTTGGGWNFSGNRMIVSQQLNAGYRYHLGDSWSLGLGGSFVFNSFSDAGQRLIERDHLVP